MLPRSNYVVVDNYSRRKEKAARDSTQSDCVESLAGLFILGVAVMQTIAKAASET